MPFSRVCGKMRWQFGESANLQCNLQPMTQKIKKLNNKKKYAGGNLQPVRMICEFDWRECPSAIVSYIWSEIVTDVVDCLTNEWMLWRVIK